MINIKDYNASFKKVYTFMDKHITATGKDFENMAQNMAQFKTPLESNMAVAVVEEIERLHHAKNHSTSIKEYDKIFAQAYKLLEKYANIATIDEFQVAKNDYREFSGVFGKAIGKAVIFEIQRFVLAKLKTNIDNVFDKNKVFAEAACDGF